MKSENPVRTEHCELCRRPTSQALIFRKNGCDILRCAACRLVSTHTPDGFDPASVYVKEYYEGGRADGYADYPGSERVIKREFRAALARLRARVPAGGSIIEVGSAYGYFLDVASRRYAVTGVDVSRHAADVCRERGHAIYCGQLADASLASNSFDAAVLLDCLEHLPEPLRVLRELRRILVPGGTLYLTTGNHDAWLSRLMGRRWRLMTPPQHLYFFSADTLRKMVASAGFRMVATGTHWKWVPVGLAAYQVGARTGFRLGPLERLADAGVPLNLFDTLYLLASRRP